jgi:hypothetical protein
MPRNQPINFSLILESWAKENHTAQITKLYKTDELLGKQVMASG